MNELQIFNNEEFGCVRSVTIDNEPWFCLKDVCDSLELSNPTVTVEILDEDERTKLNLGRQGETNFISESGLYTLIIRSRKKEAKKFRRWVTSEVLPAIRKTGSYNKISTDEYLKAVNLLVKSKKFQLPHVLNILNQAGFPVGDIPTVEVIEQSDSVRDFVKDCEDGCYTFEGETTNRVYALYNQFCDIHNYNAICHGEFSKQIKSYGYKIVDKKINGVKCRIFQAV